MQGLGAILTAVAQYHGDGMTVSDIESSGGSKSVREARKQAIYIARRNGNNEAEVAEKFGMASNSSANRAFQNADNMFRKGGEFRRDVEGIANKLGIDLG